MSSSSSSGTYASKVGGRSGKRTEPSSGKDVREISQTRSGTIFRNSNWADQSDHESDFEEKDPSSTNNNSSSSSSSSSSGSFQPFIANMQFQTTLSSRSANTPQQQFAARNASLLQKGYTLSPITGQVYRVTDPKSRSQEFVDLQKTYDSRRAELLAYNRSKGYSFDPLSKKTHNSEGIEVLDTSDPELSRLRKQCDYAKTSMKSYKQRNPVQFAPLERKRRRNVEALKRAAQRRLERLASRQVLAPFASSTASAVQAPSSSSSAASTAASLGSPIVASNPALSVRSDPSPILGENSVILAQLTTTLNTLVSKFNSLESSINERIAHAVENLNTPPENTPPTESMDSTSGNEE